jgi:hypothetical protein
MLNLARRASGKAARYGAIPVLIKSEEYGTLKENLSKTLIFFTIKSVAFWQD